MSAKRRKPREWLVSVCRLDGRVIIWHMATNLKAIASSGWETVRVREVLPKKPKRGKR